tara:strand:+ start:457 stop:858 length:402 start_codon:yes stop_codon:yes gene_type:complete
MDRENKVRAMGALEEGLYALGVRRVAECNSPYSVFREVRKKTSGKWTTMVHYRTPGGGDFVLLVCYWVDGESGDIEMTDWTVMTDCNSNKTLDDEVHKLMKFHALDLQVSGEDDYQSVVAGDPNNDWLTGRRQ